MGGLLGSSFLGRLFPFAVADSGYGRIYYSGYFKFKIKILLVNSSKEHKFCQWDQCLGVLNFKLQFIGLFCRVSKSAAGLINLFIPV